MSNPPVPSLHFAIDDPTKVGAARRFASMLAADLGFDETLIGRAALVVTEAATNLLKHAGGGELIVQPAPGGPARGMEVLALDKGPGMRDLDTCLADGFSTAGSSGAGLGAIVRLSAELAIHSAPGRSTALMARIAPMEHSPGKPGRLDFGVVNVPYPGETFCGDSWGVADDGTGFSAMVVDGLGHGPQAAEAAKAATAVFHAQADRPPAEILRSVHDALRSTRGAAMAIASVAAGANEVRFAGVGNVAAVLLNPGSDNVTHMVSRNGTLGHTVFKAQEFSYPWARDLLLVMNSDGLGSHWRLDRHSGLLAKHPTLIAGVLYRDFKRGRDDVTVLVGRERERGR